MRESIKPIPNRFFIILLALGFLARVILLPTSGFKSDVSLWQNWTLKIRELGLSRVYDPVQEQDEGDIIFREVNYPPANLYYLAFLANLPFQAPYLHSFFNFLIKFPGLVFDLLTLLALAALSRKFLFPWGVERFVVLLYWLNPALIYHGSFWGLNESLSGFLFLGIFWLLFAKKYELSLALSIAAITIKVQNVIFIPLVFLFVLIKDGKGWGRMLKGAVLGVFIFLLVYSPFLIAGNFSQALRVLTHSVGYFPFLTKGALNIWYLIDAGLGFSLLDTAPLVAFVTPRTIGIILFGIATALNCYFLFRSKFHPPILLLSFALQGFSFFMLPTEIHERYIFYMFPFLPLFVWWTKTLYWWYGAVSFTYLANLVLVYNYFYAGWARESLFHGFIVALNIVCYGYLWYWYVRESSKLKAQMSIQIQN